MTNPPQLRDGGRYELRNGDIITIKSADVKYPWKADNGAVYANNGAFNIRRECDLDIIAEVPEEKEEPMDWTFEVGKFYNLGGRKARCIVCDKYEQNKALFAFCYVDDHSIGAYGKDNIDMARIGPWVEPLAIKWDSVPPCYDYVRFIGGSNWIAGIVHGKLDNESITIAWANHIAPGWRDHVGETHYREGRVGKSK